MPLPAFAHTTLYQTHVISCPKLVNHNDVADCTAETPAGGTGSMKWIIKYNQVPTGTGVWAQRLYRKWVSTGTNFDGELGLCIKILNSSGQPNGLGFTNQSFAAGTEQGADASLWNDDGSVANTVHYYWFIPWKGGVNYTTDCVPTDPGRPGGASGTGLVPAFSFSPPDPAPGQQVSFDPRAAGSNYPADTQVSWDFGDAAPASPYTSNIAVVRHVFSQTGTFTVTLSARIGSSGAVSTYTDAVAVGGGTISDEAGTQDDCGSWIHLACHFANVLKKVFVPQTSLSSYWSVLSEAASSSYPLGPFTWAIATIHDAYDSFAYGVEDAGSLMCEYGPSIQLPGTQGPNGVVHLTVLDNCEDSPLEPLRYITRNVSVAVFVVGGVAVFWRLWSWAAGTGSSGIAGGE